jgi:hypothetical protein
LTGQGGCIQGSTPIITPQTPDATTALAANAQVGFFGSANPDGLTASQMAFGATDLAGCNANFLRSDAYLAIVHFDTLDDDSTAATATAAANMAFLDGLKPPVNTVSGGQYRNYLIAAMVVDNMSNPACSADPFNELGTRYLTAANDTNGPIASICDADFSSGLLAITERILEAVTAIHLGEVPDTSTITVLNGSTVVPNDATNGWTYDASSISIVFHGTFIPHKGDTIIINYTPIDIIR